MLDIRFVRERPELVRADLEKRQDKEKQKWLDELLELDKEYRSALQESELLRKERNELTDEINRLMAQKKEFKPKIAQAKTLSPTTVILISNFFVRIHSIKFRVPIAIITDFIN